MESLAARDRAGRLPLGQPVGGASGHPRACQHARGGAFWDTQTKNNLYGLQIGAEATLFECGRFSIGGGLKTGVFDNHAEEASSARMARIQFGDSDSTDHLAFLGEIGVQCKYQVMPRLSLKAGYEAIWLEGVALAPGQIAETYCHGAVLRRTSTYRHWASIATPAPSITGPPSAWSIRSRNSKQRTVVGPGRCSPLAEDPVAIFGLGRPDSCDARATYRSPPAQRSRTFVRLAPRNGLLDVWKPSCQAASSFGQDSRVRHPSS